MCSYLEITDNEGNLNYNPKVQQKVLTASNIALKHTHYTIVSHLIGRKHINHMARKAERWEKNIKKKINVRKKTFALQKIGDVAQIYP